MNEYCQKKQQRNNFLLLLFSELICDEKRNMTSFSCQSSIYSFLTHPNITLFSAFFAFFYSHSLIVSIMFGMCAQCAFTCIRLNGTRGIFFFRLKYINYSTLSRWSLFMGYKCVDLYLIRPHTLQILTPHGTQYISNKNTRNVLFFFHNVQIN